MDLSNGTLYPSFHLTFKLLEPGQRSGPLMIDRINCIWTDGKPYDGESQSSTRYHISGVVAKDTNRGIGHRFCNYVVKTASTQVWLMCRSDAGTSVNLLRASCQKHEVSQNTRGKHPPTQISVSSFRKSTKPCRVTNANLPHVRKSTKKNMHKPVCQFRIPSRLISQWCMPKIDDQEFPVVHYQHWIRHRTFTVG